MILRIEIIIPLYPSIESFRRFYKLMPLHPLLHLIDYRYSHQLCREPPYPWLDYYPTMSFIFIKLVSSALTHNALGKFYDLLL